MGRRRTRTLIAAFAAVAVLATVAATQAATGSDGTTRAAADLPRPVEAERPEPTAPTSGDTAIGNAGPTTEPTTIETPAVATPTTAPPSTAPPTTSVTPTGPVPTRTTPTPADPAAAFAALPKISVLVTGDSVGFTAAWPPPTPPVLPGYVSRIDGAAVIGCGVLYAQGFTPVDTYGEGVTTVATCSQQPALEIKGLAQRPTWMVVFSGSWEHVAWRPPGGGPALQPMSVELRDALVNELTRRAAAARALGTRTAFVAWACPQGVIAAKTGEFTRWYNDILRTAAAAVPDAFVVEPTDRVCIGGDPGLPPTPEKSAAFGYESHLHDRRWLWNEWIGPALYGRS